MGMMKNGEPMYFQIKEILKKRILEGEYPVYTNIPSEPQLEEEFNVSKITIRRAIEELVNEGYVKKQSGKGTEVLTDKVISKVSKGKNFTEILEEEGHHISKESLDVQIIQLEEYHPLQHLFGEKCYQIKRIFYLNRVPYIYFIHYFPSWLELPSERKAYDHSLYSLLAKNHIQFNRFVDEFDIEISSPEINKALQLEEKPLLKRQRYMYDENNRCIEYSEAFYDTAVHRYIVKFDT